MTLNIAIAVSSLEEERLLSNTLITVAMQDDFEIDIAFYYEYKLLFNDFAKLDIAFMDFEFLNKIEPNLSALHQRNYLCISIPIGKPFDKVSRYFTLRPAGHLLSAKEEQKLNNLCAQCIEYMNIANNTLQINTKKGCYSVHIDSILYCQSDGKYVSIVTENGELFRKLGKLDEIKKNLPANFHQAHKSFLINTNKKISLDKVNQEIVFSDKISVPISRAYKDRIYELFADLGIRYRL